MTLKSDKVGAIEIYCSTSQSKAQFTALMNQFFTGAEFGKLLLAMDVSAVIGLLAIHEKSEIPINAMGIVVMLLATGFFTLFTSFLLHEFYPDYAGPAVLVGAICVQATLFIIAAVLIPTQLDFVVGIFVALFMAFLVILCPTRQDGHKSEGA